MAVMVLTPKWSGVKLTMKGNGVEQEDRRAREHEQQKQIPDGV